jgi:hypothetical protein
MNKWQSLGERHGEISYQVAKTLIWALFVIGALSWFYFLVWLLK